MGNIIYQLTGGTITLLTVINDENEKDRAETSLLQAEKLIDIPKSQIQTRIRAGQPVEEITAEAAGYDLVIIGEPARNRFINRQRAPIAEELLAHVACPLLITRGYPAPVRKLLFCESGHEPSLADDLTAKMPSLIKQADQVTVLHVMSQIAAGPGVAGWALRADAETLIEEHTPEGQLLEEEVSQLEQLDIHSEAKVRHGLVVRELLDEARSGGYDLVVIGAHPGTGWERFLLGDLAREIIGRIDRPLLVMKR
jgi:nucleotide-binding universal stress UspA family protein